ncbi:MAG: ABC transporter ATP-binding protein [Endomicrobium sp.]|jgi:lipoprotein-releasing system ATP-binding protein|nr:ABC transporter ATP-binding protein [Endomicrobium sp.]
MYIKVENLCKNYKCKTLKINIEILKNITLKILSGQKIALVGPSGAGKSTLIHILGLMDKPTSGNIYIDGVDCFSKSNKYLCNMRKTKIGFVFQFHYLMKDFTVFENIIMPVWNNKSTKLLHAKSILKRIGLLHKQNCYPNELSGGEQQRVAVGRALINNPQIILADEPTGNLDKNTSIEIVNLLFEIATELSSILVIVTHSEIIAIKTDKVIKLNNGLII